MQVRCVHFANHRAPAQLSRWPGNTSTYVCFSSPTNKPLPRLGMRELTGHDTSLLICPASRRAVAASGSKNQCFVAPSHHLFVSSPPERPIFSTIARSHPFLPLPDGLGRTVSSPPACGSGEGRIGWRWVCVVGFQPNTHHPLLFFYLFSSSSSSLIIDGLSLRGLAWRQSRSTSSRRSKLYASFLLSCIIASYDVLCSRPPFQHNAIAWDKMRFLQSTVSHLVVGISNARFR